MHTDSTPVQIDRDELIRLYMICILLNNRACNIGIVNSHVGPYTSVHPTQIGEEIYDAYHYAC